MQPASYQAFCRNNGTYSTGAKGYHCWNEEMLKTMNDEMEPRFDGFERTVDEAIVNMQKQVKDNMTSLFRQMKGPSR